MKTIIELEKEIESKMVNLEKTYGSRDRITKIMLIDVNLLKAELKGKKEVLELIDEILEIENQKHGEKMAGKYRFQGAESFWKELKQRITEERSTNG